MVNTTFLNGRPRHIRELCCHHMLRDCEAARVLDTQRAGCAIHAISREDHTNGPRAKIVGKGLKQNIRGWTNKVYRLELDETYPF